MDAKKKNDTRAEIEKKEARYTKDKVERERSMIDRARMHREKKKQSTRPISASNASLLDYEYSTDEDCANEAIDDANPDSGLPSPSPVDDTPVARALMPMPTITMQSPQWSLGGLNLTFRSGLSEATASSTLDSTTRDLLANLPSSTTSEGCLQALRDLERATEVQASASEEACARSVQRTRSAGSSHGCGDSSDDGEFVKGLEARSAKWLTDLRQKSDQAPPFRV